MTQDTNTPVAPPTVEELLQACLPDQLERVAQLLERYPGQFRVVRNFDPNELMLRPDQVPEDAGRMLVIDTEGTGKDANKDLVVELGMVEVAYDRTCGFIYGVKRVFDELEDPGMPIPPEASAVNGITDEMVAGKKIDDEAVQEMVASADFIICHNSRYDRPMLERRWPFFKGKAFACSLAQVDWQKAGCASAKLEFIAYVLGFFYAAHRAESDCMALTKVLNTSMAGLEGATPFQAILDTYRREDRRIWATGADFAVKDLLKDRGYQWHDPANEPGVEKAWAKEVPLEEFEDELDWLKKTIFRGKAMSLPVDRVDEFTRFTKRRDKLDRVYR